MAEVIKMHTPEQTSNRPQMRVIPGGKMKSLKDMSEKDLKAIMSMSNKNEIEKTLTQGNEGVDFKKKLEKNNSYKLEAGDVIIDVGEDGAMLPVSINKDGEWKDDKEAINKKIAAMQKYDPNTPEVKAMIDESMSLIDDAVKKGIVEEDPNNKDYAAFCIYAANRSIKKLHPTQNEEANKRVIRESIDSNDGIAEQTKINAAGGMVCKDFAPTFATIMNRKKVGKTVCIGREREKHMFAAGNYPGMGDTLRVDAGVNTKEVLNNKAVMLYEKLEKVGALENELLKAA